MNTNIDIYGVSNIPYLLVIVLIAIFIGVIAGVYPAVFMSGFVPGKVLKGDMFKGASKPIIRKVLVVAQFVISSILVISTIMIFQQYNFVKNKDLGFNMSNMKLIALQSENSRKNLNVLRERLKQFRK